MHSSSHSITTNMAFRFDSSSLRIDAPLPPSSPNWSLSHSAPARGRKGRAAHNRYKCQQKVKSLKSGFVQWFQRDAHSNSHKKNERPRPQTPTLRRQKSLWTPTLEQIYEDEEILNALIAFMTKQYNEENILFLESARSLTSNEKTEKIDSEILSIYNLYISDTATKQINLSWACSMNIQHVILREKWTEYTLDRKQKILSECISEIERLLVCICKFQFLILNENENKNDITANVRALFILFFDGVPSAGTESRASDIRDAVLTDHVPEEYPRGLRRRRSWRSGDPELRQIDINGH